MQDEADGDERQQIGRQLRRARESRQISLTDAATELNIGHTMLDAMENGRFDELPGPPYTLGFLRSYAQFVGLSAEHITNRFKAANPSTPDTRSLAPLLSAHDRSPNIWTKYIAIPGICVALIGSSLLISRSDTTVDHTAVLQPSLSVPTVDAAIGDAAELLGTTDLAEHPRQQEPPSDTPETLSQQTHADDAHRARQFAPSQFVQSAFAATEPQPAPNRPSQATDATAPAPQTHHDLGDYLATQAVGQAYGSRRPNARIVLIARRNTRLEIGDDRGNVFFAQSVKANDLYYVANRGDLILNGDPRKFDVFVDGRQLDRQTMIVAASDQTSRLRLDPDALSRAQRQR